MLKEIWHDLSVDMETDLILVGNRRILVQPMQSSDFSSCYTRDTVVLRRHTDWRMNFIIGEG